MDLPIEKIKEYYKKNNDPYLIVCFANINYKSILANWIQFMYKSNIYNFCIICLDKYILKKCLEYNLFCVYYPIDTAYNFNDLWKNRIFLLKELVLNNIPIIHTDIDAIWVNNPYIYIQNLNDKYQPDIIGSQGLIFPETSFNKNKFIMCCGFFAVNPTPNSKKWMEKWLFETEKANDDQVAFNKLLEWTNIKLENIDNYFREDLTKICPERIYHYNQIIHLYGKSFTLNCSNNPKIGKTSSAQYPLNFVLLPMASFQRVPPTPNKAERMKKEKVYIKHYFTEKKEEDKIALFQKHGLWEDDSTLFFTSLHP